MRPPNDGGDGWGDVSWTLDVDEGANDDFGDLRLLPGSPCIDAGDNSAVPSDSLDIDGDGNRTECTPLDLSGGIRFFGDPNTEDRGKGTAPTVDLGAYEFRREPIPGDLHLDQSIDFLDYAVLASVWRTTPADIQWQAHCDIGVPVDGSIDSLDLAVLLENWLVGTE